MRRRHGPWPTLEPLAAPGAMLMSDLPHAGPRSKGKPTSAARAAPANRTESVFHKLPSNYRSCVPRCHVRRTGTRIIRERPDPLKTRRGARYRLRGIDRFDKLDVLARSVLGRRSCVHGGWTTQSDPYSTCGSASNLLSPLPLLLAAPPLPTLLADLRDSKPESGPRSTVDSARVAGAGGTEPAVPPPPTRAST